MPQVRAAGGVVIAEDGRIVLIHRPRYEDWSLPKGKLNEGEAWEDAALREVQEETSLVCRCLEELDEHEYVDRKGRPKRVRWWRMAIVEAPEFVPNDEVDRLRWVTPEEAESVLTYEHDRALVRQAARREHD